LMDTNNDGEISDVELSSAIAVLDKAKREKQKKMQKDALSKFEFEEYNYSNH